MAPYHLTEYEMSLQLQLAEAKGTIVKLQDALQALIASVDASRKANDERDEAIIEADAEAASAWARGR
jgi:hypothetical protein